MVLICESDLADSHAICEMSFFQSSARSVSIGGSRTIYANEEICAIKP